MYVSIPCNQKNTKQNTKNKSFVIPYIKIEETLEYLDYTNKMFTLVQNWLEQIDYLAKVIKVYK